MLKSFPKWARRNSLDNKGNLVMEKWLMQNGAMKVNGGLRNEKVSGQFENDVIQGDAERPLSKHDLTLPRKIFTEGAVTTEVGSLFQYFTTLIEKVSK